MPSLWEVIIMNWLKKTLSREARFSKGGGGHAQEQRCCSFVYSYISNLFLCFYKLILSPRLSIEFSEDQAMDLKEQDNGQLVDVNPKWWYTQLHLL